MAKLNNVKHFILIVFTLVSAAVGAQTAAQTVNGNVVSNSGAQAEATREVRRALSNTPNISSSSRNVHVSSLNGAVVLRGSVSSVHESEIIDQIARSKTSLPVDNQLTISE